VRVVPLDLPGVVLIEPDVYRDARGYFFESYHADKFTACGIAGRFVQDNVSFSVRGALRGLHLQVGREQAKLIRVVDGEIYDVAVDVRRGSPTFGRWVATTLSAERFLQCYVPAGFAHGFAVTSETATVEYKCTELYDPAREVAIAWDDPALAIDWPTPNPILSARDRRNPSLDAVRDRLPLYSPTNL